MDGAHDQTASTTRRAFVAGLGALLACGALARCARRAPAPEALGSDGAAPSRPRPPSREPVMRVRVRTVRAPADPIEIGRDGQRFGIAADGGPEAVVDAPVRVEAGRDGWTIAGARGEDLPGAGARDLDVLPLAPAGADLALGDREYPGTLRLVHRGDLDPASFDVINLVEMEAYLPGVVAGELFDHWRVETRAAQAIAARSFAASEHAYWSRRRAYDVTSTASSQVYQGRVVHGPTLEAVAATRGVVLAWDGLLVPGYYSSCCGGAAARAVDAIGPNPINDVPPLDGRFGTDVCTQTPVARWTVERAVGDLTQRFAEYGRRAGRRDLAGLDRIRGIEASESNLHGRPTRFAVTGRGGSAQIDARRLRPAANQRLADGPPLKSALWSSYVTTAVKRSTATFDGRGYGHGVGLCQYGAEELARTGDDHERIIAWYYPGAELATAY